MQAPRGSRRATIMLIVAVSGATWLGAARPAVASLAGTLSSVLRGPGASFVATLPSGTQVQIPLLPDSFTPQLERLSILSTDFPAAATSPGFSYRLNPQIGLFERSTTLAGPVFAERAETLGAGRAEIGAAFLYATQDEVNGDRQFRYSSLSNVDYGNGLTGRIDGFIEKFQLRTQSVQVSATYGITDRWDVNLLLPITYTEMSARSLSVFRINPSGGQPGGAVAFRATGTDSAVGVGDLRLRTKYLFLDDGPVHLAGFMDIRVPTGSVRNFQGLGHGTFTPSIIADYRLANAEAHVNLGAEIDPLDADRCRARYDAGGSWSPVEPFALLVDVIGNSSFVNDNLDFATVVPINGRPTLTTRSATVFRNDIVDVFSGFKVDLFGRGVAFMGAFFPVTHDALRGTFIPTAGVQFGF